MQIYKRNYVKQIKIGPYTTSKKELIDLLKSWIVIAIIVSVMRLGSQTNILLNFLISAFIVGTAFLFHELGHKIMAQHYGCFAEYRSNDTMLWLALIMSFLGFVFLAPGAVIISGPVGKRRNGMISAAGPGTNFIMGIVFMIIMFFSSNSLVNNIASIGIFVNGWIGLFNMIPVWMFDGKKILNWNKLVYFTMLAIGLFITFFSDNVLNILA